MHRHILLLATALLAACAADVPHRAPPAHVALGTSPSPREAPALSPSIAPFTTLPLLLGALEAVAPHANPAVLDLALKARRCAINRGDASLDSRLAVIDYSRPSTERRLWVFDMRKASLLFDEYVAHGRGSGDNMAQHFSNDEGSLQSSLGLFTTAETYEGDNGYSLRMDGLEPGVNDHARSRAIVIHGAWYVDPLLALKQGRLGRSYGCPALRPQVAHAVIDSLKQGQLLFAYYPDHGWLSRSTFLDCGTSQVAAERTSPLHVTSR